MTVANLSDVLQPALRDGYAVGGLVVLGWEDAEAYVAAAEDLGAPLILQAGPSCRAHTPLPVLGAMFRYLAEQAVVPVVAHLDHGYELDDCRAAIEAGFTSVMFDGSRRSLSENIDLTGRVVALARPHGISVEGEIGFVGYDAGEESRGTAPADAHAFARASGIDAMAISVGNVHLRQEQATVIDREALSDIEAGVDIPLVIHGGSGVPASDRTDLARNTKVCKFNIGTELRMAFGTALRAAVRRDDERFDRVAILKETSEPVRRAARDVITALAAPDLRTGTAP
ncbi:MAG: class II fructose-bisphosphate aldolase [Pseudomonadota bacterium]